MSFSQSSKKTVSKSPYVNDQAKSFAPKQNFIATNNIHPTSLYKKPVFTTTKLQNTIQSSQLTHKTDKEEDCPLIGKINFTYHFVIGRGGFGKVWKVEMKKNKVNYALKEMSKSKIITKKSVNSVMNERQLLSQLCHPFLINMNYAFQDRDTLYLVMDLLTGGDLRFHMSKMKRFTEEQTRFFAACIVAGLEYLHNNNILHRDIKPENLVFDEKGYLRITDLGIARVWRPDNASDTSGTPGYMAPEVMCRQNHGISVDYFALGVICHECMIGRRPYLGRSRKEIRDQILSKQVQIRRHEIPDGWSIEACDFINRLIQRKPMNRLGLNGPKEVKAHPWLAHFPWDKLIDKKIEAPFRPSATEDNFDAKYNNQETVQDTNAELEKQNALLLRKEPIQNLFEGYDFGNIVLDSSSSNTNLKHLPQSKLFINSNVNDQKATMSFGISSTKSMTAHQFYMDKKEAKNSIKI